VTAVPVIIDPECQYCAGRLLPLAYKDVYVCEECLCEESGPALYIQVVPEEPTVPRARRPVPRALWP
jgi:hypothetical protein